MPVYLERFHRPVEPSLVVPASARRSTWVAYLTLRYSQLGYLAIATAPLLCGCSVSMPMGSMMPADEVTASLAQVPFGPLLDAEDRRREKAALATALDPQGDGATIHWENPKTGRKGAITAVSHAYPVDNRVCRSFKGELTFDGGKRMTEGTACIVSAGEWALRDMKGAKKA